MMNFKHYALFACALAFSVKSYAMDLDQVKEEMVALTISDVAVAEVIDAIKAQNEKHASLTQEEIDALDQKWRAEAKAGSGELIDKTLANAVSQKLKAIQSASEATFSEIFVMDNKGLNVGQTDVTSDYWQGDEEKYQETFPFGDGAAFVDVIELDESSGKHASQISVVISDPATKKAIGVVTYGYIFK